MRTLVLTVLLFPAFLGAWAENGAPRPRFIGLEIEGGVMTGGGLETLRPDRIFQGAKLTLLAENPENNLPVSAETMDFVYDDPKSHLPSQLRLEGRVEIRSPDGTIRADSAVLLLHNKDGGRSTHPEVRLHGNVHLHTPLGIIEARHAEIDYVSGDALFSGDVLMNSEQVQELRAKSIEINLKTHAFRILEGKATLVNINPQDEEAGESR